MVQGWGPGWWCEISEAWLTAPVPAPAPVPVPVPAPAPHSTLPVDASEASEGPTFLR